jgi:hypothetical protein
MGPGCVPVVVERVWVVGGALRIVLVVRGTGLPFFSAS